jgi:hypothetical protein
MTDRYPSPMPLGKPTLLGDLQNSAFKSFESTMSEEEEEEDDDLDDWETGAFPNSKGVGDHVFADEPFTNDSRYYSLDVVKEGSKEETLTGASLRHDELMSISMSSSDTPSVNNTTAAGVLQTKNLLDRQSQDPVGIRQTMSSGSSGGFYPYNIYQTLGSHSLPTVASTNTADRKDQKEYVINQEHGNNAPSSSTSKPPPPSTSASKLNKQRNVTRKSDREEPSSIIPPLVTPMSPDESSYSVYTTMDQQSHSIQAPQSVFSTRSRRHHHHHQGKRGTIRQTLSTSQPLNANPATMLKTLFVGIEQERHMHKLTALHFRAVHNWLMFLPAIILTMLSGLVVFVFEADLNETDSLQVYSSIFAGTAALISVVWQAVSKQLDLGTRAALHDVTSDAMKRLSEDILLTLSSSSTDRMIPSEYVTLIGEKFGQALDICSASNMPFKLESAFCAVSDRMMLMLHPPMGQPPRKHVQKLDYMHLYATAYDELTLEMIHHWAWPFAFPQSRRASEAALRNFKAIITLGREMDKTKVGCIMRLCCPCFGVKPIVERGLFDVIPEASLAGDGYSVKSGLGTC